MAPNRSSAALSSPVRPNTAGVASGGDAGREGGPYAAEHLEELLLLDGTAGTPAIRVLPAPKPGRAATEALYARARLLWPGLDARALSRCGGDPRRVARLVARRTVLTEESIVELLLKR